MRHPASRALFTYWNELRRDRVAPRRLEIEPARISDRLLDTFVLERIGPAGYRFRLTGTRVTSRFGLDVGTHDFLASWSEIDRALIEHHLIAIADLGRGGLFTGEGRFAAPDMGSLPDTCTFEMLMLPLAHTGEAIDRFLCLIVALEEEALPADARLEALRLVAAEPVWPTGETGAIERLADRQVPLHPHVRTARIVRQGRRQFRVYEGGLGGQDAG